MVHQIVNTLGLKSPHPILLLTMKAIDMRYGDILEVIGDCPTFEKDIQKWCNRMGKVFLSLNSEGDKNPAAH